MTDGGHSGKHAGEELPEALRWLWSEEVVAAAPLPTIPKPPVWQPHPDAIERSDVPHGTVEEMTPWKSKIFENTTRDWAIYVPAQYKKRVPAALMYFKTANHIAM